MMVLETEKVNLAGRIYPLDIANQICSVQPIDPEPFRKLYERAKENERIKIRLAKTFMVPVSRIDAYCVEAYRIGIKESKNKS
ncbi:hypothetical protein F485_gp044 [Aeromonas phage CC2]|uniref:Uncharacterized protein n=1 Tax=Aeromonas phage CC2 TaxID=1204516 RepID=I6X6W3_9CAUD|nr:hypothetical protein F485_gp044 [Aeromonas phage CC2]AFN39157.1 hypothetical protein CC2_355 [Aeromonas phage CC2]